MQKRPTLLLLCGVLAICGLAGIASQKAPRPTLESYYIDTEGGQPTLFVSPTGACPVPRGSTC